jgi:hypothetical protein
MAYGTHAEKQSTQKMQEHFGDIQRTLEVAHQRCRNQERLCPTRGTESTPELIIWHVLDAIQATIMKMCRKINHVCCFLLRQTHAPEDLRSTTEFQNSPWG